MERRWTRRNIITLGVTCAAVVAGAAGATVFGDNAAKADADSSGRASRSSALEVPPPAAPVDVRLDVSNHQEAITPPSSGSTSSTSPDASNSNTSSTTITVNGQTTHVSGDASYDRSYVSDDGSTSVDISVHNSSSSSGESTREEDGM